MLGRFTWTLLVAGALIGAFIAELCVDTVALKEAMLVVVGQGTPSLKDIDVGELSANPLEFV